MRASRLMLLLCGSGLPARGYRYERTTAEELGAMADALRARRGAQSVTLIEVDAEDAVYLVTRPGHFAPSSILSRRLTLEQQARCVDVGGHTAADDAVMQTWMRQFMEQDAQMRRALRPAQADQSP